MSGKYNGSQKKVWYNGHLYDSKGEARWAVFFDGIGVPFMAHPGTFRTGKWFNGKELEYTPDFYLCEQGDFCEFKPGDKFFDDHEIQRKLSAAMDQNATPVGRGLLLLGPMSDFHRTDEQRLLIWGEYYRSCGTEIIKSYWVIRASESECAGVEIYIPKPDFENEENYSAYPKFSRNPTAKLFRSYNNERASEIIYKALFNAIFADDNGLFTPEEDEEIDSNKTKED